MEPAPLGGGSSARDGINPNTVGDFYHVYRETTTEFLEKATRNEKIGGAGRIVCIDETHVTKKKRNRGGFQGRSTLGHETILMAGVELDGPWAGRNAGVAKVSRPKKRRKTILETPQSIIDYLNKIENRKINVYQDPRVQQHGKTVNAGNGFGIHQEKLQYLEWNQ